MTTKNKILFGTLAFILLYLAYDWFFGIDINRPDCYGNRNYFKKAVKLEEIPAGVSGIRCYSDHIGADFSDEISFECDCTTFIQIVTTFDLRLQQEVPILGRNIYKLFRKEIDSLPGFTDYKYGRRSPYHAFWYNTQNKHAYFLTYSL